MTEQRYQLHPTGASEFFRCGERFRRKYIDDIREPRSIPLIIGSALDRAVMMNFEEKIRAGKFLPEDCAKDLVRDSVNDAFRGDVAVKRAELLKAKSETIERSFKLLEYAHRVFSRSILHPKSVQRKWSVRLDKMFARNGIKLEFDFVGTMDIEAWVYDFSSIKSGQPTGTSIHDLKISRKSPSKDAADTMYWLQLTSYALGKLVEDNELPLYVQIDALVDLKRGVGHRIARSERDKYDLAALCNRLLTMGRAIEAGIFQPADRGSWVCTEKWCRYYKDCPYTKNKKTVDLAVPDPKKNLLVNILAAPKIPRRKVLTPQ